MLLTGGIWGRVGNDQRQNSGFSVKMGKIFWLGVFPVDRREGEVSLSCFSMPPE